MDSLTNKLTAFIIDAGSHAEWIGHDDDKPKLSRKGIMSVVIEAKALVFSHGIHTQADSATELITSFTPVDQYSNFNTALSESPVSPSSLSPLRAVPPASVFRNLYRTIFGFDGVECDREGVQADTVTLNNTCSRLHSLLTEKTSDDIALTAALQNSGFLYTALRTIRIEGKSSAPMPVFWANGHYTRNTTEEEEDAFKQIIVTCNSHLQTRYLNSLFDHTRGFCQHLKV